MKETIAKINEVIAALQADLAKAAEGTRPLPPVPARQPSSLRNSARHFANSQSLNSSPYGNNSKGSRDYAQRRQACVCRRSGHPFRT